MILKSIILTIIFFSVICVTENNEELLSVKLGEAFKYAGKYESKRHGMVDIYPLSENKILLYIEKHNGYPMYSGGNLIEDLTIVKSQAIYLGIRKFRNKSCGYTVNFLSDHLNIKTTKGENQCVIGKYLVDGRYEKISSEVPQTIVDRFSGSIAYFKDCSNKLKRDGFLNVDYFGECSE